jgi:hypothetical protein
MTRLLGTELAKGFVWAGRLTKKHAFKSLELKNVLFGELTITKMLFKQSNFQVNWQWILFLPFIALQRYYCIWLSGLKKIYGLHVRAVKFLVYLVNRVFRCNTEESIDNKSNNG